MVKAKFVSGSLLRHILVMTFSSSVGLIALFMVDLVDIYFLSLLENTSITAAVGFAGNIMMLTISVNIGMMITMGALVSQNVGAKKVRRAKRAATNVYVFGGFMSVLMMTLLYVFLDPILSGIGAVGETKDLAKSYLLILLPSVPFFTIMMCANGALRGVGDAKRAMFVTLSGAVVNAIFDPIFIFGLDMGIEGAAWASLLGRFTMLGVALYGALYIHKIYSRFNFQSLKHHLSRITRIAFPTILTNVATPIGAIYITYVIAGFGDSAVAGASVINRLAPVVFGVLFSLSGAVGPIFGQNLGARIFERVNRTFYRALQFSLIYSVIIAALLFVLQDFIVTAFKADPEASELIRFFCTWLAFPFVFQAAQFVANAGFNNLGKPIYATWINMGKTFIGTIPFAYFGSQYFGAKGALAGPTVGGAVFGVIASIWIICYVKGLEKKLAPTAKAAP